MRETSQVRRSTSEGEATSRAPQTCWILIRAAAEGEEGARETFVRRYHPCLRPYLLQRWAGTALVQCVDDAMQEVFLLCLRENGALHQARPDGGSGFRAYLYGLVRNVARGFERRGRRALEPLPRERDAEPPADDPTLSRVFDRAYALAILREAGEHMRSRAEARSAGHRRRVELLRLRFDEGQPIRTIAEHWQVDAKWLHHQYEQAVKEFLVALKHVVGLAERCPREQLRKHCEDLLALL